jgi:hypothetical protein
MQIPVAQARTGDGSSSINGAAARGLLQGKVVVRENTHGTMGTFEFPISIPT